MQNVCNQLIWENNQTIKNWGILGTNKAVEWLINLQLQLFQNNFACSKKYSTGSSVSNYCWLHNVYHKKQQQNMKFIFGMYCHHSLLPFTMKSFGIIQRWESSSLLTRSEIVLSDFYTRPHNNVLYTYSVLYI